MQPQAWVGFDMGSRSSLGPGVPVVAEKQWRVRFGGQTRRGQIDDRFGAGVEGVAEGRQVGPCLVQGCPVDGVVVAVGLGFDDVDGGGRVGGCEVAVSVDAPESLPESVPGGALGDEGVEVEVGADLEALGADQEEPGTVAVS